MIREAIGLVVAGQALTMEQAAEAMEEIMTGQATPAQLAALVTALRMKGETPDEIAGMARVMRQHALRVRVPEPLLDTAGTGGDGSGSFNVSTAAAIVAAGAGVKVAKHGNRSMGGLCGSADVLEALGVKIDLGPEGVEQCIRQVGMGFMFAPVFHPAMKYAAGPRREIGIRTVFNILGPLTCPAGAQSQVLGVADPSLGEKMAQVLLRLGSHHALVVHGQEGFDEVSITAPTTVWELKEGAVRTYTLRPEEFGLARVSLEDIRGGAPEVNAAILRAVLEGAEGPRREVVLLNAAVALYAADADPHVRGAMELARRSIDQGRALKVLTGLVQLSQQLAQR